MSSSLESRAQEIAKNEKIGLVRARIRAAHEAFGVSNIGNEPSHADIVKAVTSGEIVMFGRLIEIASNAKVAPETAILAAKVYLAESKRQADSGALAFIDPDPDV
jgi:hypothetical protein